MSGKRWLVALAAGVSVANAGCVSCDHASHRAALAAAPACDLPTRERQKVYVFMLSGLTPSGSSGLDGLRTRLAEQGFAKIGAGSLAHAGWVELEMKQALADNPDARFVLVGHDVGGGMVSKLAAQSVRAGVPIDAVVLLDPVGAVPTGVRTLLLTSGGRSGETPHTEYAAIPEAGRLNLPTHPKTVAAVCHLLNDIAAKQMRPEIDTDPVWSYEHAPMPRPMPYHAGPELNILADRPGGGTTPIGGIERVQTHAKPGAVHHKVARISNP